MLRISDEVINRLSTLLEIARDTQFAIGDEIIRQVEIHNNRSEVISYLASQLNVSASTLYDYYRIAERWSPAMREIYQSLDWTMYRNSDPNNTDDIRLLDRAIDEGWTSTRFKEEKFGYQNDPKSVIGKVRAIITRHRNSFPRAEQGELDEITRRLDAIEQRLGVGE